MFCPIEIENTYRHSRERGNVEDGLQTGLDIVATLAWWDWIPILEEENEPEVEAQSDSTFTIGLLPIFIALFVATVAVFYFANNRKDSN